MSTAPSLSQEIPNPSRAKIRRPCLPKLSRICDSKFYPSYSTRLLPPESLSHRSGLSSVTLGEMSLAKDVISLYASPAAVPSALRVEPTSVPPLPYDTLGSSSIAKPPPIPSVQSFNARLVAGGKDETLRKASDLFKSAAVAVERGHDVGARYWMDALKIRQRNWGLTPAPLPLGAPTGRGADRTTKDFLISFGLSECLCFCMLSHADAHSHSLSVGYLSSTSNWSTRHIRFQGTNNVSPKTEYSPLR